MIRSKYRILAFVLVIGSIIYWFMSSSSYFDFDRVVHYQLQSSEQIFKPDRSALPIGDLETVNSILFQNAPTTLHDRSFLKALESRSFTKTVVPESSFERIDAIFSSQRCDEQTATMCAPVYRDLLIFYKDSKIIGVAKICFECKVSHIIRSNSIIYDSNFGHCGNYERLNALLN